MNKQNINEPATGVPVQIIEWLEGWLRQIVRDELQKLSHSTAANPPIKDNPKLAYTYKEAAAALGVCEKTLKRAVATQKISFCRIGTAVRFTKEQLDEYLMRATAKRIERPGRSKRNG